MLPSFVFASCMVGTSLAALNALEKHVNTLALSFSFDPVKESYWTGLPHHRRTPFAVSPDGKSAYLAYLDASQTDVHVQQVDPTTFAAVGTAVTITGGKEAGGLVAHDDGFALLTNEALSSGTANAPADSTPVPVLYRFTGGSQTWKTFLGGPGVHADFGLAASPDLNGDLVYSEAAQLYGAYFVITAYTGDAASHFGDSIQYVKVDGTLTTISGATSSWGCSHNTGIAFEAADAAPFASICAEDQGAIWLNTKTQTMDGVKISNENTTNGGSGEPMGGMSGSYSALVKLSGSGEKYVFAWVSRGAKDLTVNDWLGAPFTHAVNRTNGRRVAIAQFDSKSTLVGPQASSTIGAADGDSQVNWVSDTSGADANNAHVAAFNDGQSVVVTWEEIDKPQCNFIAMGCQGTFTGSRFQLVTNGSKVGDPIVSTDTYVAGDMVTLGDGRVCWPYVSMTWSLSSPVPYGGSTARTTSMSFACLSIDSGASSNETATPSSTAGAPVSSAVSTQVAAASSSFTSPSSILAASSTPIDVLTSLVTSVRSSSSTFASSLPSASVPPSSSRRGHTTRTRGPGGATAIVAPESSSALASNVTAPTGCPVAKTITKTVIASPSHTPSRSHRFQTRPF